ncbi:MAG TPA: hypothetical protein VMN36_14345 [Verrucomicrobiales bacterium]|nr:hypothetical protein [Verrucomicrobiales bacterium]
MRERRWRMARWAALWLALIWSLAAGVHWWCGRLETRGQGKGTESGAASGRENQDGSEQSSLTPDERRFYRRTGRDGSRLLARRMEAMTTEERMAWLGGLAGSFVGFGARSQSEAGSLEAAGMNPEVLRILREEFIRVFAGDEISPELRAESAPLIRRLQGRRPSGGEEAASE